MALVGAKLPTFMMVGRAWQSQNRRKHQAAVQGLGHWDWFGGQGGIHRCDPNAPRPQCPLGWQSASELLGFMTKYLYDAWWRPPYLLGSSGGRLPILHWFDNSRPCALKVRWDDPASTTSLPGEVTLGGWSDSLPW